MSFFKPKSPVYIVGPTCVTGKEKVTNEDFVKWINSDIKPRLLEKRTGINTRYWASKDQAVSDLGYEATQLLKPFKSFDDLAVLVFSTISSDYPVPPTGPLLQSRLGLDSIGSFDLSAACAGFVTALITSAQMSLAYDKDILLCSAEIRSKFLDPENFETAVLFGDGASSCLLSNQPEQASFSLLCGQLFSDGSVADIISIPHGGSRTPHSEVKDEFSPFLKMKAGAELYIKALSGMHKSALEILDNANLSLEDIDWVVPHQANLHMILALAKKLDFPNDKVVQTIKKYGNTSGASVGMALSELKESYPIKSKDKVLLISAGGGGLAANAILEVL